MLTTILFVQSTFAQSAPAPAAPPSDDAVHAAVDKAYGKDVPDAAVCIERPSLPEPLQAHHVTVVATKRGARGCVLLGVMVDDTWLDPLLALPAALDPTVWAGLDGAAKSAALLAWTDGVLLAFDQPSAAERGRTTSSKGAQVVARRMLRRTENAGESADLTGTFTFAPTLVATVGAEDVHDRYTTRMFMRPSKLDGVAEEVVDQALTSRGGMLKDCFAEAWSADLALSGRVILEWHVGAGKADTVAVVAMPSETTNDTLAQCYARAIRSAPWAPEASGQVKWVFFVERTVVE